MIHSIVWFGRQEYVPSFLEISAGCARNYEHSIASLNYNLQFIMIDEKIRSILMWPLGYQSLSMFKPLMVH